MTAIYLTVPQHVRGIDTGHTVVLVDNHRATTHALTAAARLLWATTVAGQHEYHDQPDNPDHAIVEGLAALGLIQPSSMPANPPPVNPLFSWSGELSWLGGL